MVWSNDPGRVNMGKGYRVVNRLGCPATVWGVDGVYPSPDGGCTQQPLLLALRLILIISRAAQYVVCSGPRFRWELCAGRYSFDSSGGLSFADRLPDISPEVAGPN